jgi:hypothetical protein
VYIEVAFDVTVEVRVTGKICVENKLFYSVILQAQPMKHAFRVGIQTTHSESRITRTGLHIKKPLGHLLCTCFVHG